LCPFLFAPFNDNEGDVIGLIRTGGKALYVFEDLCVELAGSKIPPIDHQILEPLVCVENPK